MKKGRQDSSILFGKPTEEPEETPERFRYDHILSKRFEEYMEKIPVLLDEEPYTVNQLAMHLNNVTDILDMPEGAIGATVLVLNALHPKYRPVGIISHGDNDHLRCADEQIYGNIHRIVIDNYAEEIERLIRNGSKHGTNN